MLPVEVVLPDLAALLSTRSAAVLQAPPGAGKTTRVPLALYEAPWLGGQKVVMLEPRRLAARAAAGFMARLRGEAVGQTVGYRIRSERKTSPATRIEVVTEGILTRMLQTDPALEGIGLVVFDEFHERSLHADLGLALCLEVQQTLRPDLRLLVMSATLDGQAVASLLGDAPVLTSAGRLFPVETHYLKHRPESRLEPRVSAAIRTVLARETGDLLVFLPGAGEIRRVVALLAVSPLPPAVQVYPLYGDLSQAAQEAALAPAPPGQRKVVLATSIAETSLTIEGVRVVIDSGLARIPRFSPRTGMTRLTTVPASQASADQRRGRAGRLGPGVCYRLWTEADNAHRPLHLPPEVCEADLAPLALELAAWGVSDPASLAWLDAPPAAAFTQARHLLMGLGALDEAGRITPHGREMAALGLHPRLAHLLLKARPLGLGRLACELAALLEERDLFRSATPSRDADLRLRLEALRREAPLSHGYTVEQNLVQRVRAEARRLMRLLGIAPDDPADPEQAGVLLAFAYPDRIARRRPGQSGRFLLANGRAAALEPYQSLAEAPWLVAAELDGEAHESRIFLAAPVTQADLERHLADRIAAHTEVVWDEASQAVRAQCQTRLGALVLQETPVSTPDPHQVAQALLDAVTERGVETLSWTKAARHWQQRVVFLHTLDPTWPDVTDAALQDSLADWLGPHLMGLRRLADVQRLDLHALLQPLLPWPLAAQLDALAPTHLVVPSGSRIPIDYHDPTAPVLAVRLQEVFGLTETPRLAGGRVPVTVHLLSPAHRPVQITRDLASFWRTGYFDVRKDLKGRYPKHSWPDDPLNATPTRRVRPA
jgi:ATP-dependent helicase HrpB